MAAWKSLKTRFFYSVVKSLYIMRTLLLTLLIALVTTNVSAREYGRYDTKRLLTATETPEGKKYGFGGPYLGQMMNDLSAHARNYPPQFDTPQDKQRATNDVKALSGMLDLLINNPNPDLGLLTLAGDVNSMGHNLDIPGAAQKANSVFLRLLAAAPSDPRGNYMYGNFLAGVGKPKEALPYLEKALAVGVVEAAYTIGMAYLTLGNKEQALKNLENYKQRRPSDGNVDKLIDAIRNGRIEFKRNPG
jgi:predicted Zn-dependent protease